MSEQQPHASRPLRSPVLRRAVAPIAATLALVAGPETAAAIPEGNQLPNEASEVAFARPAQCSPHRQVKLTLKERPSSDDTLSKFTVRAQRCRKYAPRIIEEVELSKRGAGKTRRWDADGFRWGETEFRRFSVKNPKNRQGFSSQTVALRATDQEGDTLGYNRYQLNYNRGKLVGFQEVHRRGAAAEASDTPVPPTAGSNDEECLKPGFKVGFTDYNAVWQRDVDRETVFNTARRQLGACAVRIMLSYGEYKTHGLQSVIDTLDYAKSRNMTTMLVLFATPTYLAHLDPHNTLSATNLNPSEMYNTAYAVATRLGSKVNYWAIGNEHSHPYFNATTSMDASDAVVYAGEAGLDAALEPDPAKVRGELAPKDIGRWLPHIAAMRPGNNQQGISAHLYSHLIDNTADYVARYGRLFVTEAGQSEADPNQAANNARAIAVAKAGGADAIYMYQVMRVPSKPGTGIATIPTR